MRSFPIILAAAAAMSAAIFLADGIHCPRELALMELPAVAGGTTNDPCTISWYTYTCQYLDSNNNQNACVPLGVNNCAGACNFRNGGCADDFCDNTKTLNVSACQIVAAIGTCGNECANVCHVVNNNCQCQGGVATPTGNACKGCQQARNVQKDCK